MNNLPLPVPTDTDSPRFGVLNLMQSELALLLKIVRAAPSTLSKAELEELEGVTKAIREEHDEFDALWAMRHPTEAPGGTPA